MRGIKSLFFESALWFLMAKAVGLVLQPVLAVLITAPMLLWVLARHWGPPDLIIGDNYLHRWYIIPRNRFFNIYVHHIMKSDDDRALHDHPWWSVSFKLWGRMYEILPTKFRTPRLFVPIVRSPRMAHRLVILPGESCWTLFITGPRLREWGFWCHQGWRPWYEYVSGADRGQIGKGCE